MKINKWLILAAPTLAVAACNQQPKDKSAEVPKRTVFFDKSAMDTTVNPGDNFFEYASGSWLKKTKIPESQSGWGSFFTLYDDNLKNLNKILVDISKQEHDKGSNEQKVADMYASGMDTVAIEKLGYTPLKPTLDKIKSIKDYKELTAFMADSYKEGGGYMMGLYVGPDDKNSTKNLAQFSQAGLGMPNRDYYFKTDSASVSIRKAYVDYITKMFTLTGTDAATAAKNAGDILKLETEIAQSHSTPVELRDPVKNYHKYTVNQLQQQVPEIDIKDVFKRMGFSTDTILVGQPKYYVALGKLLKTQPIEVWKNKLSFMALNSWSTYLSKPFRDARFDFFGRKLNGQKSQQERWKAIVQETDDDLGELLGQLYVERYFPADAKKRMLGLVNNLQDVYRDRIQKLDWMGDETKKKAEDKLNSFTKKIGYPDKWKKYDDVDINRGEFFKNVQAAAKHNYKEKIDRINKTVDKTEWGMTPPTVNAYYNPSFNEIVFPAGILQFPFFDKDADDAINYGAIGAVIGHEMTHGFDDQGSQYDKDGNLKVWWTKNDETKFKAKTAAIATQYSAYTILDNQHVNGNLTLGENIADNGGVAIAYQAFKNTPQGKGNTKIDGLTPDQRFFLAYAQVWRIKSRDESLRMRLSVDPHSPEMYRVNGPLSNIDAWYKAFNIKPGDKLYKPEDKRIKIW
ncbi:M13 family metallopeptidase [uncultured Mucilaginibacter sp.]|uniref:M13 family metallopeptidase n=1 Tax=uncultured Mucilaginibacter sp. TaxID=797541 RepID=UPI0025E3F149|nr:M13 family metallopeptidase [uncultured Mucilaginibacter sp.]